MKQKLKHSTIFKNENITAREELDEQWQLKQKRSAAVITATAATEYIQQMTMEMTMKSNNGSQKHSPSYEKASSSHWWQIFTTAGYIYTLDNDRFLDLQTPNHSVQNISLMYHLIH